MQAILQNLRYKPVNASNLIGTTEIIYDFKRQLSNGTEDGEDKLVREALDFVESFPISSPYVHSCMSPAGFSFAMHVPNWGAYEPDCLNKQQVKKELEEIQK